MKASPLEAVRLLEGAFHESVTAALCQMEPSRRAFDEAADALEKRLAELASPPPAPAAGDLLSEEGVRIGSRGYVLFWLGVLTAALAAFAAGIWTGTAL
ncbi:MAG: hypothetical protein N2036_00330 [Bryobacteraceae bacterium]|nr:hypothetical protein [Bryobacteraceae bacterium]MCX7602497.1 hypothetical protein [Bryobacteraceae bacterium]